MRTLIAPLRLRSSDEASRKVRWLELLTRLDAFLVVGVVALASGATPLRADDGAIDSERSRIMIFVYKSGLFSAFADNHIVSARVASGDHVYFERSRGRRIGSVATS